MMFLVRAAFWLCVVILLLPPPAPPPAGHGRGPSLAEQGAQAVGRYCLDNPQSCAEGSAAAAMLGEKLTEAASFVGAVIAASMAPDAGRPSTGP